MLDWICAWCADVVLKDLRCSCSSSFDPVAMRRRHREAVQRAQRTDGARQRLGIPTAARPARRDRTHDRKLAG